MKNRGESDFRHMRYLSIAIVYVTSLSLVGLSTFAAPKTGLL